jgi:hypothetical protein
MDFSYLIENFPLVIEFGNWLLSDLKRFYILIIVLLTIVDTILINIYIRLSSRDNDSTIQNEIMQFIVLITGSILFLGAFVVGDVLRILFVE